MKGSDTPCTFRIDTATGQVWSLMILPLDATKSDSSPIVFWTPVIEENTEIVKMAWKNAIKKTN